MEKTVAARDKEIADLRAGRNGKPGESTPVAPPPPAGKVFRTGAELLADMPRDAYPRFGEAFGIEQAAAQKWANEKLVGRTVEWQAAIKANGTAVSAERSTFYVSLTPVESVRIEASRAIREAGTFLGAELTLGGEPCVVFVHCFSYSDVSASGVVTLDYPACTVEEAKRLRGLDGKKVLLRATIEHVRIHVTGYKDVSSGKYIGQERVLFILSVSRPSVDGFLPEADKPKESKDKK